MPILTIHHKTEYRYARPVAFGEHRMMLRPRDGHDLRVLGEQLTIDPSPVSVRWIRDVFGNTVGIVEVRRPVRQARVRQQGEGRSPPDARPASVAGGLRLSASLRL